MTSEFAQHTAGAIEVALLLGGAVLLLRLAFLPAVRRRWLGPGRLPPWPLAATDFCVLLLLVLVGGLAAPLAVQYAVGPWIQSRPDHDALAIVVLGSANYAGAGLAWLLFRPLRRLLAFDPAGELPPPPPAAFGPAEPTGPATAGRRGVALLLVSLVVVNLVAFGWNDWLRRLGLPDEPQPLLAIFGRARTPWLVAALVTVACVLAPLYEELLFRAGIYRFCRQRLGRAASLAISGFSFGALHWNWAGFLPLSVLGMLLALGYEATGSLAVAVIAHGLFNLNTLALLLAGVTDLKP